MSSSSSSSSSSSAAAPQPLTSRDINTASSPDQASKAKAMEMEMDKGPRETKSMEYHRQVLRGRLEEDGAKQVYVSPSDTIMSPCTAKLSAYKSKQFGKAKPQSLFAKMEASRKTEAAAAAAAKADEGKEEERAEGGP